jgi:anti-sigma-K factor RskA
LPQAAAPEQEVPPAAATLAADLLPPETEPAKAIQDQALTGPAAAPSSPGPAPKKVERSADVVSLESKVKRWRDMTLGIGALAALLAIYIAVGQFKPDLIPAQMRPAGPGLVARTQEPARSAQDRLVAVLQQQPTAPAFLLTLDTQKRTLIVRRVSATPEAGRSYELWLISKQFPSPRSLGIVGNEEFTQRALPANTNVDTLRGATYAVSLEPAGGSPSGVPTGPVLFTGKAVESLPATPSPANATPKT